MVVLWLFLGLLLLLLFLAFGQWFTHSQPKDVVRVLKVLALVAVLVAVGLLVAAGRGALVLAALTFGVPWVLRWWRRRTGPVGFGPVGGPGGSGQGGGSSAIDTPFLQMTLDHASGRLAGRVVAGPFAGRALDGLSFAELMEVHRACVPDEASLRVLEAWLDREGPPDWRARAAAEGWPGGAAGEDAGAPGPGGGTMDRDEALRVLGLEPGASAEDIRAAHRRLMSHLHPDHGGSSYLAAQINRARDVLLGS